MISNLKNIVTFSHNQSSIQYLIKHCNKISDLKPLKSLLIVNGLTNHKHVISKFMEQCFDLGTPDLALKCYYASQNSSLLLQNLVIKRLCNLGLYQDVINVYKRYKLLGNYTFPYVIKACSALSDVELGREIHCVVIRSGYDRNVFVQTALVDFYAKIGRVGIASLVFDEMPEWDVVSWNALISGYAFNGFDYEAVGVLIDVWRMGVKANVGTLASVVPVCTRLGFRHLGSCLHGYAMKCGFGGDEMLIPAFISMYGSDGDVYAARCLFELSLVNNVVFWNSMICAYTQNQQPERAFELFLQMVRVHLRPNMVTFVSVIPSCEKMDSLSHGECLHGCVTKHGFDNQVSVATALISMYAKLGDINTATYIFSHMPNRNLLTWNSIISGYVHQGLLYTSLEAIHDMRLAGFQADPVSIINILSVCSELQNLLLGKSAHAISIRKGFDSNLNVMNSLLALYSNCHQLHSSFKLFERMAQKNNVSWNTMISGSVHNGETQKAGDLLLKMQQEAVQVDVVGLVSILPSYTESSTSAKGTALHAFALKYGFISDITLANALIMMYCNHGYLDSAALLFNSMIDRDLVSWNSLITGYRCHNLYEGVIILFKQMMNDGLKPNYISLLNVLPGCCTLLQGKSIHCFAIRTNAMLQTPFVTSLIHMYARFKNIVLFYSLFEAGDKFDISLWNVMLAALVEAKEAEKALALFCELLQTGLRVDYVTVLSVVSVCSQLNSLSVTDSVVAYVIKNGYFSETSVCNALVDLFAKSGDLLMAREIFERLLHKDAISWSVMINAYGMHGDVNTAISILSQMENSRIKPDPVTYLNILTACSHAGLVEHSKIIFSSMLNRGIQPTLEHCACLVDLLGRKGQLYEAYDIVERLPGGPSVSILESLLGACVVHGNVKIGEMIGELLIERNPGNSAGYVTLHNIYAAAGRWEDANRMRTLMEENQVRKVPAFSMLEGNIL